MTIGKCRDYHPLQQINAFILKNQVESRVSAVSRTHTNTQSQVSSSKYYDTRYGNFENYPEFDNTQSDYHNADYPYCHTSDNQYYYITDNLEKHTPDNQSSVEAFDSQLSEGFISNPYQTHPSDSTKKLSDIHSQIQVLNLDNMNTNMNFPEK